MSKFIDLTGQRFGRWFVLGLSPDRKYKRRGSFWSCKCSCGTEKDILGYILKKGITNSCGCLNKEIAYARAFDGDIICFNKVFIRYKSQAKRRNIIFNLSKEEFLFLIKKECFYCGNLSGNLSKTYRKGKNEERKYNGIDRIDSARGYEIDNVVPCCGRCNEAKMSESQEDFLEWVERVYRHSILKENQ